MSKMSVASDIAQATSVAGLTAVVATEAWATLTDPVLADAVGRAVVLSLAIGGNSLAVGTSETSEASTRTTWQALAIATTVSGAVVLSQGAGSSGITAVASASEGTVRLTASAMARAIARASVNRDHQ